MTSDRQVRNRELSVCGPFGGSWSVRSPFDQLFREFFGPYAAPTTGSRTGLHVYRSPVADYQETDKEVIATFEIPGVDTKNINWRVHEGVLEIKAQKKDETEVSDENTGTKRKSYSSFNFATSVSLPDYVKTGKGDIITTYANGVLELRFPKQDPKAIEADSGWNQLE